MDDVAMATLSSTILYDHQFLSCSMMEKSNTHVSSVVRAAKYSVSWLWTRIPAYISLAILTAHALRRTVRDICLDSGVPSEPNGLTQDQTKTQRVALSSVVAGV